MLYNQIFRLGLCNSTSSPQEGDTTISIKSLYTAYLMKGQAVGIIQNSDYHQLIKYNL